MPLFSNIIFTQYCESSWNSYIVTFLFRKMLNMGALVEVFSARYFICIIMALIELVSPINWCMSKFISGKYLWDSYKSYKIFQNHFFSLSKIAIFCRLIHHIHNTFRNKEKYKPMIYRIILENQSWNTCEDREECLQTGEKLQYATGPGIPFLFH